MISSEDHQEAYQSCLRKLLTIISLHLNILKSCKRCLSASVNYILIKVFNFGKDHFTDETQSQAKKILKLYFEMLDSNVVSNAQIVQGEVVKAAEECFGSKSGSMTKLLGKRRKSASSI